MTLYNEDVKRIIKSYDWPPGNRLIIDPVDGYDENLGVEFLELRIYRDNFIQFDGVEQQRIANIFNDLIPRLHLMGVNARFNVAPGDGRIARG